MDTITQGLLGAVTAQLGFRAKLGAKAPWIAAAVAVLPDADSLLVSALHLAGGDAGPFATLRHHRGLSHGLVGVVALGLIAGGVWAALRRRDLRWVFGCTLVAALSHPLLDVLTTYGTQLLSPLTDRRFALHAVPIVDLIYTGTLVVALIAAAVTRRFTSPTSRAALAVAWIGFGVSVGYLAAGRLMHDRAVERGRAAFAAAGLPAAAEVEAYPALGGIFVWRLVGHDEATWYVGRTHLLSDRPIEIHLHGDAAGPLVDKARANDDVKTFAWFAAGQLRAVRATLDGHTVIDLHDMRYGRDVDSGLSPWMARVVFDDDGNIVDVRRAHAGGDRKRGPMLWRMAGDAWRGMLLP